MYATYRAEDDELTAANRAGDPERIERARIAFDAAWKKAKAEYVNVQAVVGAWTISLDQDKKSVSCSGRKNQGNRLSRGGWYYDLATAPVPAQVQKSAEKMLRDNAPEGFNKVSTGLKNRYMTGSY